MKRKSGLAKILTKEFLQSLVDKGLTLKDIVNQTGYSNTSIHRYLTKYGIKTPRLYTNNKTFYCKRCGETEASKFYNGRYSICKKCSHKLSLRCYKNRKYKVLKLKGSKCSICGYDKYIGALEFHHLDPNTKEIGLSQTVYGVSEETRNKELDKCILVCANCHREIHANKTKIPNVDIIYNGNRKIEVNNVE